MRKKNNVADYAIAAFRYWARKGYPSYDEAANKIYNQALAKSTDKDPKTAITYAEAEVERASAALSDILACETVFREFESTGNSIVCDAVREIYMIQPQKKLNHSIIRSRVLAFAVKTPMSEAQVYRYLAKARDAFAMVRNLRNDDSEDE